MADDSGPSNVINFPHVGFTGPTGGTPATPEPEAVTVPFAAPADPVAITPAGLGTPGRRSPLDTLSALREPGLPAPFDLSPTPALPVPGFVPDAFRAEPADPMAPRLGALSLAAILAVSVAALRGMHSAVTAWKANREQRKAVADAAEKGDGKKGKKNKKIPAAHEYGQKSLGRSAGGSASRSSRFGGSKGSGSSGKSGSGSAGGSAARKRTGGGTGTSAGAKKPSSGGRTPSPKKNGSGGKTPGRAGGNHRPSPRSSDLNKRKTDTPAKKNGAKDGRIKAPGGGRGPKGILRPKKDKGSGAVARRDKNSPAKKNGIGRTSLSGALKKDIPNAARNRWERRKKTMTPPIWSAAKGPKGKGPTGGPSSGPGAKPTGAGTGAKKNGPKTSPKGHGKPGTGSAGTSGSRWAKASSRARQYWQKRQAGARANPAPGPGPSAGTAGPNFGGPRTTPWQSAGAATAGAYTVTVERTDNVGDQERGKKQHAAVTAGQRGLPTAPTPHTARPGTASTTVAAAKTAPKENPVMAVPVTRATGVPGMDAQHATEITLDDALDVLEELTQDSFKTHDECLYLAAKARDLRTRLENLAIDLALTNNVIGALTSAAMTRLAESMDILARKADEMQVSSLQAAELSEAADTSLNDAYRPITQATADAGLTVPSARIHNEG